MMKDIEKLKENRQKKQMEKIKLEEEKNRLNKGRDGAIDCGRKAAGELSAVDRQRGVVL